MTHKFTIALAVLTIAILACTPLSTPPTPTSVPTRPPAVATLAPTPVPAATSTRVPTPQPSATSMASGVLFSDDFGSQQASEDKGWVFEAGENVDRSWSPNKFIISVKKKQYLGYSGPKGTYDDFGLEVEAQASSGYAEYGPVFRISENNYYVFGVTTDGKYYVDKFINGEWANPGPVAKTASQYIKQGKVKNKLAVLAQGNKISLYINGFGIKTITDASLSEGQVGMFAGSGNSASAEVAFSRLTVLSVEKAQADFGPLPGGSPVAQPTSGQPPASGSGNGVFYVRNNFGGACQVTVWGKSSAIIRAEGNSTASKSLPPGTYGAKVALANGREADVPGQLQLPAGGYCSITCFEKSYNYGCGQ